MVTILRFLGRAAVAAGVPVGVPATGTACAQSACADLGGTVNPDQTCHVYTVTSTYTVDLSFPTSYPDQQPLTDYLTRTRDGSSTSPSCHPSMIGRIRSWQGRRGTNRAGPAWALRASYSR